MVETSLRHEEGTRDYYRAEPPSPGCSLGEWLKAARALRASRQPPDPVRELREAWGALSAYVMPGAPSCRLVAAIAALEKEGK